MTSAPYVKLGRDVKCVLGTVPNDKMKRLVGGPTPGSFGEWSNYSHY